MNNSIIIETEHELFITDSFFYNKRERRLDYHIMFGSKDDWCTFRNVAVQVTIREGIMHAEVTE